MHVSASAAFPVVAEDSCFTPCGVYLWLESPSQAETTDVQVSYSITWTNVSYRIYSAIAPDRCSAAAERVDLSSVLICTNLKWPVWPLRMLVLLLHFQVVTYFCRLLHTWGLQLDFVTVDVSTLDLYGLRSRWPSIWTFIVKKSFNLPYLSGLRINLQADPSHDFRRQGSRPSGLNFWVHNQASLLLVLQLGS